MNLSQNGAEKMSKIKVIWANRPVSNAEQLSQEHVHSCHQLYYIEEGSERYAVGDNDVIIKEGSCYIIPSGMAHHRIEMFSPRICCYELKLLIEDEALSRQLAEFLPPLENAYCYRETLDYVYRNWSSSDPEVTENIECLVTGLLMKFFIGKLQTAENNSKHILTDGYGEVTKSVITYVEQNFSQDFSLSELGKALSYNKNYLCTVFSKETGYSIVDYLNFVRIRYAVIFFVFYGQDVFTTFESNGFTNASHFSRTFKAMVGLAPRSFRKVFLSQGYDKIAHFFADEPILNYRKCSMKEAFDSLKSIGSIAASLI